MKTLEKITKWLEKKENKKLVKFLRIKLENNVLSFEVAESEILMIEGMLQDELINFEKKYEREEKLLDYYRIYIHVDKCNEEQIKNILESLIKFGNYSMYVDKVLARCVNV
jgi:hypothetical protein